MTFSPPKTSLPCQSGGLCRIILKGKKAAIYKNGQAFLKQGEELDCFRGVHMSGGWCSMRQRGQGVVGLVPRVWAADPLLCNLFILPVYVSAASDHICHHPFNWKLGKWLHKSCGLESYSHKFRHSKNLCSYPEMEIQWGHNIHDSYIMDNLTVSWIIKMIWRLTWHT